LVGTCIELGAAYSMQLSSGYNNLAGFTDMCIKGTLNNPCTIFQCNQQLPAHQNYWGAAQNTYPPTPNPVGPYNPFMWSEIDLRTVTGTNSCYTNSESGLGYCKIFIKDDQIAVPAGCGTGIPIVRPVRSAVMNSVNTTWKGYEPTAANEQFVLKDLEVDPGNPQLNTTNFEDIALDSALVYAALQMEIYDSLGNDANAVALFHEILTSPLDRTNKDIRWRMEWGRYNMKSAMENMFMQDELTAANNTETFETPVSQYVDVLNTMTDTILTDSTYKEQFYVEIDKGQLFRTLGNPLMARHIYMHLDDCQLDSLEQSILNNWRQEVDIELSLLDQYINEGVSPDSISFEVDTTSYTPAVPYFTSDYYFGVWIDSPTSATFVNCGDNPEYRIQRQTQNNLTVYPNPSTGFITLQIEQEGLYDLTIFDISGKQIYAQQINVNEQGTAQLDLSGIVSTGNYMIVIENGYGMMLSKLVIAD
jgi:Secretion system C-terminal sorting domain